MLNLDFPKVERLAAEKGMSIADLARSMKLNSPNSLYAIKYAGGNARAKTIARIAKGLKCSLDDILAPSPLAPRPRKSTARAKA